MKRDEKNMQSRQKIIDSARIEFAEHSYSEASLNTICSAGNISKGIIYHYFKDKDGLYLVCIQECFDALTAHLSAVEIAYDTGIDLCLQQYFGTRTAFFAQNPIYLKLFCSAVMTPPQHLISNIAEIKAEFDALNISILTRLLSEVKLRTDMTIAEAVNSFRDYQDFINTRYPFPSGGEVLPQEHERWCIRSMSILLYGLVEREE